MVRRHERFFKLSAMGFRMGKLHLLRFALRPITNTWTITGTESWGPARLRLAPSDNVPTGTYFADWILSGVQNADQEEYGERRVDTTLERSMQNAAIQAFRQSGIGTHQAALVAMRTEGRIVAILGGIVANGQNIAFLVALEFFGNGRRGHRHGRHRHRRLQPASRQRADGQRPR